MTLALLAAASRRHLQGGAALLGAGTYTAGAAAALDEDLLAAAAAFCALECRMRDLIEGPARIADDGARGLLLRPLRDAQAPHLDRLCSGRARSLAGHRARADAFALWDGGELTDLAQANGFPADRLLAALVRDLTGVAE